MASEVIVSFVTSRQTHFAWVYQIRKLSKRLDLLRFCAAPPASDHSCCCSRQRSMSQNETEALWQTLEKMGIHTSKIESSDQEGCENKDMLTMVPEWSV